MMRKVVILIGAATFAVLATGAGWSQNPPGPVGEKATVVMQTIRTSIGQDFQYPLLKPQITVLLVEVAPGGQTGRHMHPIPISIYVLEGTWSVAIEGQGEKVYKAGDAFVEPINTWHNGMNRGTTSAKFLVTVVGEEGKPARIFP